MSPLFSSARAWLHPHAVAQEINNSVNLRVKPFVGLSIFLN